MVTTLTDLLAELADGRIPSEPVSEKVPNAAELNRLIDYLTAIRQFTIALANGDLSAALPGRKGPVAGSLKSLHASLKHLTWQTKQIAQGDFSQRVDFMGEFSDSFNSMVERLEESRSALEVMNRRLQEDYLKLQSMTAALRESEARFRHIADHVSDVIWTLDRSMDYFSYVSPSIAKLRGLSVAEALAEPIEQSMTPESLAHLRKTLSEKFAATNGDIESGSEVIEIKQICQDGRIISVEVAISAVSDAEGRLKEFVGVARDVTQRRKAEDLLKYQSTHDAMTDLYNRAFFDAELERARQGREFPVSFIVADLDGLKGVNDSLGHEAGDLLIKGAAMILQMAFRGNDVIARTGGDEFVILLNEMGQEGAEKALKRIRSCMGVYNSEKSGPPVSLSLGAATALSGEEIPGALKEADERMYADKVQRKRQRTP